MPRVNVRLHVVLCSLEFCLGVRCWELVRERTSLLNHATFIYINKDKVQITPFKYRESSNNPLEYVLIQFTF
jgi:hypothetical protein